MKTKHALTRLAATFGALAAFSASAVAQVSPGGVYKGSVAGNGPQLVIKIEDRNAVEVTVLDADQHRSAEAEGPITNGAFSVMTTSSTTVAGTFSADGSSITGTFTSGTSARSYTATRVAATTSASPVSGLYDGTATTNSGGGSTSTVSFTIDPAGNVTFLQKSGTAASPVIVGALGSVTLTAPATGTYSFTLAAPGGGGTITGTFTATGGQLAGTFTAGGTEWRFTAFKSGLAHRLINLSTRGFVNTGQGQLIGGFVIQGGAKQVLIIARGPSLAAQGVSPSLATTKIQLVSGGQTIASNAGWKTNANFPDLLNLAFTATLADGDSAVLARLAPGPYTSIVTSADGTATGIALVEVYEVGWE